MWRNRLQIYKAKRNLYVFCFIVIFPNFFYGADAPKMPSMPEMPQITTELEMPSISNPVLGGSFYKPSMPGKTTDKTDVDAHKKTSNSNAVLSETQSQEDLLQDFFIGNSNNSILSAQDITSLYDSGLFSNISSLNNTNANFSYNNSQTALLQQILIQLNELKKSQNNVSEIQKEQLSTYQQDSKIFRKRDPSILRFKINSYSLLDSFVKIFFSEPEEDGSFLLTADRKYFTDQKQLSETFYILFKASKNSGNSVIYNISTNISQDIPNENSYIYKLAQLKNLKAEKTGNLVTIHEKQNNLNIDILLDIDKR